MTSSIVPAAYSFQNPVINAVSNGNGESWVINQPLGSLGPYRSDLNSTIVFNIASADSFLKTTRMFFAGTIIPRDSSGNPVASATTTNSVIPAGIISRLVIKIGGIVCEDISHYP